MSSGTKSKRKPRPLPIDVVAEFERRIVRGGPDDCWLMGNFPRQGKGYQTFRMGGRWYGAHRIACELAHGVPKPGQQALHSCHEPQCLNHRHLRWGTQADNIADAIAAGRSFGTAVEARLPWRTARDAKQMLANGMHPADVARAVGVSINTCLRIRRGEIFAEIHVQQNDTRLIEGRKRRKANRSPAARGPKLDAVKVAEIKQLRAAGVPRFEVAKQFRVCADHIAAIDTKQAWAHVAGPDPAPYVPPAPNPPRTIVHGGLTHGQVWDIKRDLATGMTAGAVARKHERALSTIRDIARGRSWAFINPTGGRPSDQPRHLPKAQGTKRGPVSAGDVQHARRLHAEGVSVRGIIEATGLPDRSVRRIVTGECTYARRLKASASVHATAAPGVST